MASPTPLLHQTSSELQHSMKGISYQVKLIAMFYLKATIRGDMFCLRTEVKGAGKFDDLVFQYKTDINQQEYQLIILQAKHRNELSYKNEKNYITISELTSPAKKSFSLAKCFYSWWKIKHEDSKTDDRLCLKKANSLIICTTIGVKDEEKQHFTEVIPNDANSSYLTMFSLQHGNKVAKLFQVIGAGRQQLYYVLREASDVYYLADEICSAMCKNKKLSPKGENSLVKKYHIPLVEKVLNVEGDVANFRTEFVENILPEAKEFREIMEKCILRHKRECKKTCKLVDFQQKINVVKRFKSGNRENFPSELPQDHVTQEDVEEFLKKLLFAVNQPSEEELDDIIKNELEKEKEFNFVNVAAAYNHFYHHVDNWFKRKSGECFTEKTGRELLNNLKIEFSRPTCSAIDIVYKNKLKACVFQLAKWQPVSNELRKFLSNSNKRVLCIEVAQTTIGSALVLQALEKTTEKYSKPDSFLFIKLSSLLQPETRDAVNRAFQGTSTYDLLVLDCEADWTQEMIEYVFSTQTLLTAARFILVAKPGTVKLIICQSPQVYVDAIIYSLRHKHGFADLTPQSQNKLLQIKVNFQGHDFTLENLLTEETYDTIDDEMLVELLIEYKVQIGYIVHTQPNPICTSEMYPISLKLYRNRKLCYTNKPSTKILTDIDFSDSIGVVGMSEIELIKTNSSLQSLDSYRLNEHSCSQSTNDSNQIDQRILLTKESPSTVIISDGAGTGKSTLLDYLTFANHETSMFILIRIDLNQKTNELSKVPQDINFSQADKKVIVDFLVDYLIKNELKTTLEKRILKNYLPNHSENVVIMVDAIDEISPNYKEIVTNFIRALQKHNFRLIVTTRPQQCRYMECALGVLSHSLCPLSGEDQRSFLVDFWQRKIDQGQRGRIEQYAKALIDIFNKCFSSQVFTSFCGVPLQLRMLADVFFDISRENQEGCMQFCNSTSNQPKLPSEININKLYELFVKNKIVTLLTAKAGISKTNVLMDYLVESIKTKSTMQHQILALRTLLPNEDIIVLLTKEQKKNLCFYIEQIKAGKENIGLVNSVVNGQPQFSHRTFAEFYFAKYLNQLLKNEEKDNRKVSIFMRRVLVKNEFNIVRKFLNAQLSKKMVATAFEVIAPHEYNDRLCNHIVQSCIKEGTHKILQIVLKWMERHTNHAQRTHILNSGIIFISLKSRDFKCMRRLLEHGADVNLRSPSMKCSPIHETIRAGWIPGLDLLFEFNVNVNTQDRWGNTALHLSIEHNLHICEIQKIINRGAKVRAGNHLGKTPHILAIEHNRHYLIDHLPKITNTMWCQLI